MPFISGLQASSGDDREIAEAGWFSRSNLPQIPSSISIARRLIDWFVGSR